MAIARELRDVAQEMVDQYGWSALDDRTRIMEWLGDRNLLSPLHEPDHRADLDTADMVESHMRWLLS
jgi:hypothetical protein